MSAETNYSKSPYLGRAGGVRELGQDLLRFAHYFLICLDVARQRRQLLALGEGALKDIGRSRADAFREANRGFWDIPEDLKTALDQYG